MTRWISIAIACLACACGGPSGADGPDAGLDAPTSCPDNDPPVGSQLTCHMVLFLGQAGFGPGQVVVDAAALRASGAEPDLVARGFVRQPDQAGDRVYELGQPVLHGDGQRALFHADGSVELVTMASANGGFVEDIRLGSDGSVAQNDVEHVPV